MFLCRFPKTSHTQVPETTRAGSVSAAPGDPAPARCPTPTASPYELRQNVCTPHNVTAEEGSPLQKALFSYTEGHFGRQSGPRGARLSISTASVDRYQQVKSQFSLRCAGCGAEPVAQGLRCCCLRSARAPHLQFPGSSVMVSQCCFNCCCNLGISFVVRSLLFPSSHVPRS